jgi:hypothetical protein
VTVVGVDRDLPLVYVSLGQRLTVLAAIILLLRLLESIRGRPRCGRRESVSL